MNKHFLYYGAFAAVCASAVSPITQTLRAADAAATDAAATDAAPPSVASRTPINLARGDVGARLEARAPKVKNPERSTLEENDSAQALITDDSALTYPLLPGKTSLLVTLPKIQVLNHFNFINFDAAGKYTISISSTKLDYDAPGWHTVASGESFDAAQVVATDIGSVEARYVKIDFDTERPGRIASLGLFGAPVISSYQKKPLGYAFVSGAAGIAGSSPAIPRNVYFDLANLDTGARVVALSRGADLDAAQSMIDGNVESSYAFDPTDPAPAVVVDFGVTRAVDRLSCVYVAPPGRLDFYLVDNPYPRQQQHAILSYVDSPSLTPVSNTASGEYSGRSGIGGRQAIYSVDTSLQPGLNRLAADMTGQKGRFLVAEFHPLAANAPGDFKDFKDRDFKDRDFKDKPDFKDFKDQPTTAANAPQALRILSLSAFGANPNEQVVPQIPPVNNPGGNNPVPPPGGPIQPPGGNFLTP